MKEAQTISRRLQAIAGQLERLNENVELVRQLQVADIVKMVDLDGDYMRRYMQADAAYQRKWHRRARSICEKE